MLFFPEVGVDFQDWNGWAIDVVGVRLRSRGQRDVDGNGHHHLDPDCFQYLITMNQLEVVSDVLEGPVKVGHIVWAGVIKNAMFNALCLALEFSWHCICGNIPTKTMATWFAKTIAVSTANLGGRAVRLFFLSHHLPCYLVM
jgi:hypothetical protein